MASNAIRFTGLASGMDTESLVKAMMMRQKQKVDKQTKKEQLYTWKQETWKDMNSKISKFQEKYIDTLRMQSTFLKTNITTSNDTAISVSSSSVIPQGSHQVEISRLATSAYMETKTATATANLKPIDGTTTLGSLEGGDGLPFTGDLKIQVNGKEVTLTSTMTINNMITEIKKADSNLAVSFDKNKGQFFVNSTITGINSKTDINAAGGTTEAKALLNALGLADANGSSYSGTTQGVNAQYKYNGMGNVGGFFESESNEVTVNGIQMTFKQAGTGSITIQGSSNTGEIVNLVKEFVTEYNSLIEDINTKLKTKTKSNYEPLTDEEKEATSEANVEKVEKYVKDGLFYRDSALMELKDTLRNTLGEVFEDNSAYKTLYSIGIKTGDWKEGGKLHLDEAALTKALKDKPEEVRNLFAGSSTERSGQGLFNRLSDSFRAMSKSTDFRSFGSFYNDKNVTEQLKTTADKIYELNQQYNRQESALYKKFTAMEKMISKLNNQQTSLTNMLGQN